MLAWVAKWESQRKSERMRSKAAAKRNRAGALGQRATWGGGSRGSRRGVLASAADERGVLVLKNEGKSLRVIAAATGLSKSQVGQIVARATSTLEK